ncbi:sugar phosphate isomerase/epimerase [Diaminobutyricimonas aerilata]|uniref:Sugar phosphate isomerase/epimerase n=1 Tax=Diaminobutyricimonas aerilata TaxID=1162967 RepID=A0A2M9CM87_9MICO|nr:TIM barrel protein [Diaminobutyricimonas aerilata]PJJ72983.1 sugar phosphate isomerase/epimerase [Diaminobutyricimonas aerilata]
MTIAVSSFSLRSELGPLRLDYRQPDGSTAEFVVPYPAVWPLDELPGRARDAFAVEAVEICQIQWTDPDDEHVQRMADALASAGVELLTVPIDVGDLADPDDSRRRADVQATLRWFEIAATLGAGFVRVNAGSPIAGTSRDETVLVATLRELGDQAASQGMRLLVENHGGISSSPAYLLDLLEAVGTDRLGLLLDLGNLEPMVGLSQAAFAGQQVDASTVDFAPLYDAVRELAPHAELVHAKSFGPLTATAGSPFDVTAALTIVRDSGYRGPITIEYEGEDGDPWEHTRAAVELVRGMFSAGWDAPEPGVTPARTRPPRAS